MLQRISAAQAFNKQAEASHTQQDSGNGDYLDIPAFLSADNNQPDEKASAKKKEKAIDCSSRALPKTGFLKPTTSNKSRDIRRTTITKRTH